MDSAEYRKLQRLIEPCLSLEALDEYIRTYFEIDLPWDIVDEESTSSSLKFMWEVYRLMLTGQGPSRHVLACSRNTAKTLTSAMIQYFGLVHFRRDGLHLAATQDQSYALIRYIDKFLRNPVLVPYTNTDNVRNKGLVLPANDFTTRPDAILQVATATKKGTNSQRSSLLTLDEVDLTPPEILSEVAFVSDPSIVWKPDGTKEKRNPIFIYLSSRKTNNGPIQELIDEAEQQKKDNSNIRLHKWSMVDWQAKCPDDVHKPEKGTSPVYLDTESLETKWSEEAFNTVPDTKRDQFKKIEAYEGCNGCPAWVACQGRSVKQKGRSFMLRDRTFIGDVLSSVKDPAAIIAQALNWKPEITGLVFKTFSHYKHVKAATDFYKWVTFGSSYDPNNVGEKELQRIYENGTEVELASITPTKEKIYQAMVASGWLVGGGVDWGYSDPAVVVVAGYHKKSRRTAVLHVETGQFFSNHVWAQHVMDNVHTRFPMQFVAPDQADPSSITYFSKGENKIKSLGPKQKPRQIVTGVSYIRGQLWNPQHNRSDFAILDDSQEDNGNSFMITELGIYAHAKDAMNRFIMDKFEDNHNHSIDALRYFLHPFTLSRDITQSSVQFAPTETNHDLVKGAARNDQDAIEKIREKEDLMSQFTNHMFEEHGLSGIMNKPKIINRTEVPKPILQREDKPKTSKSSSGIKFSI